MHAGLARAIVLAGLGDSIALHLFFRVSGIDGARGETCECCRYESPPAEIRFHLASPQSCSIGLLRALMKTSKLTRLPLMSILPQTEANTSSTEA
jgi:hypothetical protein